MPRRWLLLTLTLAACDECERPDVPDCGRPEIPIWQSLPILDEAGTPQLRLESGVAALGTELVIAGGYSTGVAQGLAITDQVHAFDTLADAEDPTRWRALPPLPVRWTHVGLAAHGGRLFALGGHEDESGTSSGRAFILEPNAIDWREVAMPMPAPRGAAAVLVSSPFIYLFGGADGVGPRSDVIAFHMVDETWQADALPALPTPRSHTAVMERYDGTLIVAGGLGLSGPLGDVYRLVPSDASEQAWRTAEPMTTLRGGCVYGSGFGSLVCAGGETGAAVLDLVERFDPSRGAIVDMVASGEWTVLPSMPEARGGAQGAMIGGKLYVVGGSRSIMLEPTDTILVFSFVDTIDNPDL